MSKPTLGDRATVYAVTGRKVLDETGRPVTTDGTRVTWSHYWRNLHRDGDVTLKKPAAKKEQK